MNIAHHLMPILFLVSSLIQDTYGKPHVASVHTHHQLVPGSHHLAGEYPSVPGSHHIVLTAPGSDQIGGSVFGPDEFVVSLHGTQGIVDPVHTQHNVIVERPVVQTIVVTASPPQQVIVPYKEFHETVLAGPGDAVQPPQTDWDKRHEVLRPVQPPQTEWDDGDKRKPEQLLDREPKCLPHDNKVCSEVALDNGYMVDTFLIETITIDKVSSCSCCGLCRKKPECLSLAFNWRTKECRLYKAVAGYTTFTRDDNWKYSISRNSNKKSQHEEFCRRDSDCFAAGDACRGRICTNEKTVLCSTIYDRYMRGGKSGKGLGDEIIDTYGWIKGGEMRIACTLNRLSPGFTVLFRARVTFKFNDHTVKHYNTELKDGELVYANLALAEHLRTLTKHKRKYRLQLYSILQHNTEPQSILQLSVPKRYPVIGKKPRSASANHVDLTNLGHTKVPKHLMKAVSLPYLAHVNGPLQGKGKRNMRNGLLSLHMHGAGWGHLGLARGDGQIHLFVGNHKECALLMHE